MEEDQPRRKPGPHEVGMLLDALSIEELEARVELLSAEITRLQAAIAAKRNTRSAAESFFRR